MFCRRLVVGLRSCFESTIIPCLEQAMQRRRTLLFLTLFLSFFLPQANVTCTSDKFTCNNGNCTSMKWTCNGRDDCGDSSDEIDCQNRRPKCNSSEILCGDGLQCISETKKCDRIKDCFDALDELNCSRCKYWNDEYLNFIYLNRTMKKYMQRWWLSKLKTLHRNCNWLHKLVVIKMPFLDQL